MRKYLTTITGDDIGKHTIAGGRRCESCGRASYSVHIASAIGPVQRIDVGKRVYRVDGVIQVENDDQRNRRLARRE